MPMILIGCDGGTNATSGVVPEITRKLYDLTVAHRIDEARELQYKLTALFDAMIYSADFPEGFRAALKLRGIDTGESRQPYAPEQHLHMETVSNSLACLLAEEGFADEPVGGCPTGAKKVDPAEVSRIVQGVLAELKQRGLA
jgi:4-hydroxy-tetrahydrodipicolinate synthase